MEAGSGGTTLLINLAVSGEKFSVQKSAEGHTLFLTMQDHPNDPLHGVTLKTVLTTMVERHGWPELADRIPVRCFMFDPSIQSSLTFLRKTPWARQRLEDWYVFEARR